LGDVLPRSTTRVRRAGLVLLALLLVGGLGLYLGWGRGSGEPATAVDGAAATGASTSGPAPAGASARASGSASARASGPGAPAASVPAHPGTGTASGTPTTSAKRRQVDVSQTYSGWEADSSTLTVGGYVSGVVESGGTCTLTVTKGKSVARATSSASPDASTTDCAQLAVPGAKLSSGTWSGVLSYESSTSTGQSQPFAMVVP
jgi:hypothetical protein